MRRRALLLSLMLCLGCGEYGLPTGRDEGDIDRGEPAILDLQPKVGSQGAVDLPVYVIGVDTFFDETTEASFPGLEGVRITAMNPLTFEDLELILTIDEDAPLESAPLAVSTSRDGQLRFEAGFTVVQ